MNPVKLATGVGARLLTIETTDKFAIKSMLTRIFEQYEFQPKEVVAILKEVQQRLEVRKEEIDPNSNLSASSLVRSSIKEIEAES